VIEFFPWIDFRMLGMRDRSRFVGGLPVSFAAMSVALEADKMSYSAW
jgi:hypothetical protein